MESHGVFTDNAREIISSLAAIYLSGPNIFFAVVALVLVFPERESPCALFLFTGKRQGCFPMLHHVAVGRHVGGQAEVVVVVVGDVQNASSVRNEETLVDRRF